MPYFAIDYKIIFMLLKVSKKFSLMIIHTSMAHLGVSIVCAHNTNGPKGDICDWPNRKVVCWGTGQGSVLLIYLMI